MKGLILLDGPDCAGKTTLADALIASAEAAGHKAVRRHLGKPENGTAWQMHADALLEYIEEMNSEGVIVIADRHFLSEGVYGRCYRSGSEYPHAMRFMDMLFNRFIGLKVICCPPVETVVETHKKMLEERYEEYSDGMDKVAKAYQDIWHSRVAQSNLPGDDYTQQLAALGGVQDKPLWYHYDYTVDNVDQFACHLLDELKIEGEIRPYFEWNYTGTPSQNSVLLVGDKMEEKNALGIPFFSNTGSSAFLAKTLHKLMLPAEQICMVNINDPNGPDAVSALSHVCGRIVVLGREAERTMTEYGFKFDAYVRHPKHAGRFNHADDTYAQELAAAIGGR